MYCVLSINSYNRIVGDNGDNDIFAEMDVALRSYFSGSKLNNH